jgi:anti-sigma-K factor RskA
MTEDLHVLAAAYALNALDPQERQLFEEHLTECENCAEEVRGMQRTATELSLMTDTAPPPELRDSVLHAISQVRPLAPVVDNVIALRRARVARSTWQGLAAACALIAILLGGWGYSQHRDVERARSAQGSASTSPPEAGLSVRTTSLSKGSGTIVYAADAHKVVLIGRGMPALPAGKTYQLWMLPAKGKAVSAGVFQTDAAGNVAYQTTGDLTGFDRMGISIEPAGGSAQPTPSTVQLLNI